MKKHLWLFGRNVVCASALLVAGALWAAGWVKYEAQPTGSSVKIDGTSTLHDWTVEGKLIRGSMEFEEGVEIDPTQKTIPGLKAGKLNARVEVSILVRSLKSGKSSMDSVMQQAMKQKEFPTIEYRMKEMVLKEPHTSGTPFVFDTKGELTVAGVARTNLMQVAIDRIDKDKLKATGSTNVKMTDFGIQPPSPKMAAGLIKTGDDVKITFEWLLALPAKTADASQK
jgi:polyisoprenoid-binding protein YceI